MTEKTGTREIRGPTFKPQKLDWIREWDFAAQGDMQTRRIAKPQPHPDFLARGVVRVVSQWPEQNGVRWFMADGLSELRAYPYGPAATVWALPEPLHREFTTEDADTPNGCLAVYADDNIVINRETGRCMAYEWERDTLSSMFMPLAAARDFVVVSDVRAQRLQDISEADAVAEGIMPDREYWDRAGEEDLFDCPVCGGFQVYPAGAMSGAIEVDCDYCATATKRFSIPWDSIYAKPKAVYCRKAIGIGKHSVETVRVLHYYESHPWRTVRETREYRSRPWIVRGNPYVFAYTFGQYTRDPGRTMP